MSKSKILTKSMRESIVDNIIRDVPQTYTRNDLNKEIDKIALDDFFANAPKEVVAFYKDKEMHNWLWIESKAIKCETVKDSKCYARGSIDMWFYVQLPRPYVITPQAKEVMKAKIMEAVKQWDEISAVREKLMASLNGIRTVKRFIETFPELEKYLSPEAASETNAYPIAVANVMADLSKLGFPKGAKVEPLDEEAPADYATALNAAINTVA